MFFFLSGGVSFIFGLELIIIVMYFYPLLTFFVYFFLLLVFYIVLEKPIFFYYDLLDFISFYFICYFLFPLKSKSSMSYGERGGSSPLDSGFSRCERVLGRRSS